MPLLRPGSLATLAALLFLLAPLRADDTGPAPQGPALSIEQRLRTIFVSVDFTNAKLEDALQALAAAGKPHDPDPKGIQFVISPAAGEFAKPITLKLDQVPMIVALHYMSKLAQFQCEFHDTTVSIDPPYGGGCGMDSRTFRVDPSFVGLSGNASIAPSPKSK